MSAVLLIFVFLVTGLACSEASQTAPEAILVAPLDYIYSSACQGQPSSRYISTLSTPVRKIIIGHTASGTCDSLPSCCLRVRNIQQKHFNVGLSDIAWNWLIGGDGNIYEGRGWDRVGAHTEDHNYGSIGIAFIGSFQTEPFSTKEIKAFERLVKEGLRLGKISETYTIKCQSQFLNTTSPGAGAVEVIKTWPNYSLKNVKT